MSSQGSHRAGASGSVVQGVDNSSLYKALEVSRDAANTDIKKAYHRLALKFHPDKPSGNAEMFKRVSLAYQTLSDPMKRAAYDAYGEQADGSSPGAVYAASPYASPYWRRDGGSGADPRQAPTSAPRRGPISAFGMCISLADLYIGLTARYTLVRAAPCVDCGGSGALAGKRAELRCPQCGGRGETARMAQLAPGMFTRIPLACVACDGKGALPVPPESQCRGCGGKGARAVPTHVEVPVEPGMLSGERITCRGVGAPGAAGGPPGDIIFQLNQEPHPVFRREGHDLWVERAIPLVDALCGVRLALAHLDGRLLRLETAPGQLVQQGSVWVVPGAGMPILAPRAAGARAAAAAAFGDLYVRFTVVLPPAGSLGPDALAALRLLLPRTMGAQHEPAGSPSAKGSPASGASPGSATKAGPKAGAASEPPRCGWVAGDSWADGVAIPEAVQTGRAAEAARQAPAPVSMPRNDASAVADATAAAAAGTAGTPPGVAGGGAASSVESSVPGTAPLSAPKAAGAVPLEPPASSGTSAGPRPAASAGAASADAQGATCSAAAPLVVTRLLDAPPAQREARVLAQPRPFLRFVEEARGSAEDEDDDEDDEEDGQDGGASGGARGPGRAQCAQQ